MSEIVAPLVEIEGLSIRFGGTMVVRDLDLTIRPGECVALVGESGSGKSVTARALIGLAGAGASVTARRFRVDGRDAAVFRPSDWRKLRGVFAGLVMQDALVSLDPLRTIGAEVSEVLTQHNLVSGRTAIDTRVLDTLTQVGIPEPDLRARQYAHQLSGGLRQRGLIAAAIAGHPQLIIADEPTTALDVTVQAQVLDVLRARVRAGAGLLLISHDLSLVAGIADQVHVMRGGEVVDSGPTHDVLTHPRHAYTRGLLAAAPSADSRGHRLSSARFGESPTVGGTPGQIRILREPLNERRIGTDRTVLEVDHISKHYDVRGRRINALVDASFTVRQREVVGVVGESGSGKSTIAKIVLGLIEPDSGTVRLEGARWSGVSEAERRPLRTRLQYIPQDPLSSFDPRYDVAGVIGENLDRRVPDRALRRDLVADLMHQVGLSSDLANRRPQHLSGG